MAPEPLRATLFDGQSVKTDKTGWYLRKNRSLAVGEDGAYYVLTVPGGLKERFAGVRLQATPPPLEIGKGGRDGESGRWPTSSAGRLSGGDVRSEARSLRASGRSRRSVPRRRTEDMPEWSSLPRAQPLPVAELSIRSPARSTDGCGSRSTWSLFSAATATACWRFVQAA